MLQTRTQVLQALLRAKVIIIYSYMLLYVMRIMNRCIASLILIKYYVMLVIGLNLLFMIEYAIRHLCKLCFDVGKLVI